MAVGGLGGAIYGAAACHPEPGTFDIGRGPCAAAGGLLFGALGAGLGALIGSGGRAEHWERVALDF
jgi:hypothetical protein